MGRLATTAQRIVCRQVLGLMPDPDSWPEPSQVNSLAIPQGSDKSTEQFKCWALSPEASTRWPRRRTVIGAQAYRFEQNGVYDCGWRLVDVGHRFLVTHELTTFDIVTIIPPPPIFTPVPALEWSAQRLARRFGAAYRPDLFTSAAPIVEHADSLRKPPVPLVELYRLDRPAAVFKKKVLLSDWRWLKGRCMMTMAKALLRAGADVTCFAWLE